MSKTTTKSKSPNQKFIEEGRKIAYRIATRKTNADRTVSVDQVRPFIEKKYGTNVWGSWASKILGGDERFRAIGETATTVRAAHGRPVTLYRLHE